MGHYNGIETSYEKFCVKENIKLKNLEKILIPFLIKPKLH